jgi:uncharacterized protein YdaU (DUF1376 family)
MNFYPFHVGDYASHTKGLSLLEDLAFRRLIDLYYLNEAPITDDIERASRVIGMREHIDIVSYILSEYFLKSEDGYRNTRCDAEIAKYHAKAARAKKACESRWGSTERVSEMDLISDADQMLTSNQEPVLKTSKKSRIADAPVVFPESLDNPEFRKVWSDYLDYRKGQRYAKLKPASVTSQLATLASWGQADAISSIQTTIRNGWQGIFAVRRTISNSPKESKSLIQFA